jgi:phosphoserine phosphatase RsbU/P
MKGSPESKIDEIFKNLTKELGSDAKQGERIRTALKDAYDCGNEDKLEQQIYLRHLMEHLPDRIYFKDLKSRFLMGNRAFSEYFGVERNEDIVGKTDFDFFPHIFAQQKYEDEQRIIREGKPVEKDEHDEQKEGQIAWSSTTKMPLLDEDGKIIGTFGLSRDITDKKLAEEKLIAVAEDLRSKNEQIEADLAMARKLQIAFIPTSYPSFTWDMSMEKSALQFSHRYVPSAALAGDFFQIIPISNTKAGILMCDVMGHGIRASLVTAILKGLVGELKLITPFPHVFLRKVNRSINTILKQLDITLFVTAFYGVIDLERGTFYFANAGHPCPIKANRRTGKAEFLRAESNDPDPALGLIDNFKYAFNSIPIEEQDTLVFYTDGLIEVEDDEGTEFGLDRFLDFFKNMNPQSSDGILDKLMDQVHEFSGGKSVQDDMCIVRVDIDKTVNS